MNSKNLLYILACISFCTIIGAGIYEHIAVWPVAFSEPPQSLTMFQGSYATQPALFWKFIHPLTLILLIITVILNWQTERRKYILVSLITYITMVVATFIYFVPELMHLTGTPFSETVDASLQKRGNLWIILSLIRMTFIVVSAIILLLGLTMPDKNRAKSE